VNTISLKPLPGVELMRTFFRVSPATLLLALSIFTTGFSGLVTEYVLATTATYILGNSIYQWSMIIATMMLAMGVGAWMQKWLGNESLIQKFALIEVSLALVGGFSPLINYWVFAYLPEFYSFTCFGLAALIGMLIGFEIPVVLRINEDYLGDIKENAAWIFGLDYVGSFVGAVVWIRFYLPNYPLTEISFLVAGANFGVAILAVSYFTWIGKIRFRSSSAILLALTAVVLLLGYAHNNKWAVALEQKFYDDRVVYSETSKYQHIVLTEDTRTGNVQLFLNGNKQFASSDEQIYHDMLVHPVMSIAPQVSNVLILGGGDGMALREVLKYPGVETVTLVDLDPQMVQFASNHSMMKALNQNSFAGSRVRVVEDDSVSSEEMLSTPVYLEIGSDPHTGESILEKAAYVDVLNVDAARYLGSVEGNFNVIIVDLPDPSSAELVKLYSREILERMRSRLSPGGMLAMQSTSPYLAKEAYLTIGATLRAAGFNTIPYHQNVPSFGEWGWYLAYRSGGKHEQLVRSNIKQLKVFPVETRYITPEVFRASTVFGRGWLEGDVEVSTLTNPVLLDLYLNHSWLLD